MGKAKEELASAKDGIGLSCETYEIIDKILELPLFSHDFSREEMV